MDEDTGALDPGAVHAGPGCFGPPRVGRVPQHVPGRQVQPVPMFGKWSRDGGDDEEER